MFTYYRKTICWRVWTLVKWLFKDNQIISFSRYKINEWVFYSRSRLDRNLSNILFGCKHLYTLFSSKVILLIFRVVDLVENLSNSSSFVPSFCFSRPGCSATYFFQLFCLFTSWLSSTSGAFLLNITEYFWTTSPHFFWLCEWQDHFHFQVCSYLIMSVMPVFPRNSFSAFSGNSHHSFLHAPHCSP